MSIFGFIPLLAAFVYFVVFGVGIYVLYLLITALRIYIKKNS